MSYKKYNNLIKTNPHLISVKKLKKKFSDLKIKKEIEVEIEKTKEKITDEYKSPRHHDNTHNIILGGESLLNINNLVDTSSIFDNISSKFDNESIDFKKSSNTYSSRMLKKINFTTKLGEIKEEYDQKEKYEKKKISPVKGIDESCSPISLMISNSPINLRHDQILEKEIIVKEINPFNNDEN